MRDNTDSTGEYKPAITAADISDVMSAMRARTPARLRRLMERLRARGITDGEVARAVAASRHLVDALGGAPRR